MSADSWTVCPKCAIKTKVAYQERQQKAHDSYGVVPASEYRQLIRDALKPMGLDEPTFREDYEVGVYDGEFYVSYRGSCIKCGWTHVFKHQEPVG